MTPLDEPVVRPRLAVSPRAFSRLALASLALNVAIVLTGAAVRLTRSGMGCPTWPTCDGARLVGPWRYHTVIESGNRLFTVAITVGVTATLLASLLRRPRRRDLCWLSFGLVAGVLAQAVLGGITVLTHLEPPFVMAHFVVSMAILVDAVLLWLRAKVPEAEPARVAPTVARMVRITLYVAALVIVLGTATTAAGPHSGGEDIRRLGNLGIAVQVHGAAVVVLVGLAFWTRLLMERTRAPRAARTLSSVQLWTMAAQGLVGIVQWEYRLPRGLVELHVAGAVAVWLTSVWLVLRTAPAPVVVDLPDAGREDLVAARG